MNLPKCVTLLLVSRVILPAGSFLGQNLQCSMVKIALLKFQSNTKEYQLQDRQETVAMRPLLI